MYKILLKITASSCMLLMFKSFPADKDLYFDADFMNFSEGYGADKKPELNSILQKDTLLEGRYPVILYINNKDYGQVEIDFTQQGDKLVPLVPLSFLNITGVKSSYLDNTKKDSSDVISVEITQVITEAESKFETKSLTLYISIPQIYIDTAAKGYVSPTEWDGGINAARLNYQASAGKTFSSNGMNTDTANVYMNTGLNFAGWRARSSLAYQEQRGNQIYNTYVERDLPRTFGKLMIGELFTQGDVIESLPFRGIQASSDVDMLPDAMQGYAPVIRGVANSQAKVEIRQHGYSLYTSFFPPGPFEIRDLNTAASNGDLEIIITEANGEVRRFTQPYATLGNLLRQGTWRYNLAAGTYNSPDIKKNPKFLQVSSAIGLTKDYTFSSAFVEAESYRAIHTGVGKGLAQWGAISFDVTHASTKAEHANLKGQSYSLRYGKLFSQGTNLRFTGYRYSTGNYRSFTEAMSELSQKDNGNIYQRRRSRLEANISQNVGESSSLYALVSQQDYWGNKFKETQAQLGLNTTVGKFNVGMYVSKSLQNSNARSRNQQTEFSLAISIPFGSSNVNSTLSRNSNGGYQKAIGLNGTSGEFSQGNYSVNISQHDSNTNEISASGGYRMPWTEVNAGVVKNSNSKSVNMGITGSLLAHSGGVEASKYLGETVALVQVDNTANVDVQNNPGNPTNERGYSVLPYLRPYRANRIVLDTRNTENNTIISSGVTELVPRRGAIVKAHFHAVKVNQILSTLSLPDGSYVPFGAAVNDVNGKTLTVVGQAGQILFSTDSRKIVLHVNWGNKPNQTCQTTIDVNKSLLTEGIYMFDAQCQLSVN